MPIDWEKADLDALIANFRSKGVISHPVFLEAMERRERKGPNALDFKKTLVAVREAAAHGRFLSYKAVAEASDVAFEKVHWSVGSHLLRLLEYARGHGWPPLSAIVVNIQHVDTGRMEESALQGFLSGARAVGYEVAGDDETALRSLQQAVFAWARAGDVS